MFILNRKNVRALLLISLFGISVLIRLPDLRSSLNRESEWQSGHVLTTLSIWKDDGISKHYFSPVWTFDTPADRYTNSLGGIKDKANFTYYTSYPPFGFILPYTILQLFDKSDWVFGLRIISLIIHFLCALLIFLIVTKLFGKNIHELFFLPAYVGFCIYVFSAGNLWFHGNFYFADSLVHLFILSAIYVVVLILGSPAEGQGLKNSFLFLSVFLGVYTEWLAFFVSVLMALYLGYGSFKNKV
jgi:hypothetical protein